MRDLGNKEIMAKNIKHQMLINNKKAADVCSDLDIKKNTFSDWVNGKTYPRIDKIEQMAHYFHCTKSALIESSQNLEIDIPELNATISAMNSAQKQNLLMYANFILGQNAVYNSNYPVNMELTDGEARLIKELRERTEIDTKTLEQMFNTILHYKQDEGTLTIDGIPADHRVFMVTEENFAPRSAGYGAYNYTNRKPQPKTSSKVQKKQNK